LSREPGAVQLLARNLAIVAHFEDDADAALEEDLAAVREAVLAGAWRMDEPVAYYALPLWCDELARRAQAYLAQCERDGGPQGLVAQ
jgi:hypothetical protein